MAQLRPGRDQPVAGGTLAQFGNIGLQIILPDQRRHRFNRLRQRQRQCIAAAVKQPPAGNQSDGRIKQRRAPVECALNHFFRVTALFLPLFELVDVLAAIAAGAFAGIGHLRAHQPAANISVQRGQADAQLGGGSFGGEIIH